MDIGILQFEPPEHYHYLFGLCFYWPITRSARLVATLSLISFLINLIFLLFSSFQSILHLVGEIAILFVEFVCIALLFYGISHKKAYFLRPYLVLGVIWNACLIMLWVLCLVQLYDQNGFRFDVLLNISEFVTLDTDIETFESTSFWLTILLIIGLTITIAIGFWFLHIIYSTYNYFVDRHLEIWDQHPENKQLLIDEQNTAYFIKGCKNTETDPSKESLIQADYDYN